MSFKKTLDICLLNLGVSRESGIVQLGFDRGMEKNRLLRVSAALSGSGFNADVVDVRSGDHLKISGLGPKLIVASPTVSDIGAHLSLMEKIRSRLPGATIVITGELASFSGEEIIWKNPGLIDHFISGDPDENVLALARALSLPRRRNIARKSPNGGGRIVISSAGCGGACSFCAEKRFHDIGGEKGWRGIPPSKVADEIEEMLAGEDSIFGRFVTFADPNFPGQGRTGGMRALAMAREISGRNLNICFEIRARVDSFLLMPDDALDSLREAGLVSVFLGIESFNPRVLKLYNKNISPADSIRVLKRLSARGISVSSSTFIPINPWSDPSSLDKDYSSMKRLGLLTIWNMGRKLMALPGSRIERTLRKEGLLLSSYRYDRPFDYRFINPAVERFSSRLDLVAPVTVDEDVLVRKYDLIDAILANRAPDLLRAPGVQSERRKIESIRTGMAELTYRYYKRAISSRFPSSAPGEYIENMNLKIKSLDAGIVKYLAEAGRAI